jgi:hypothetical protein
MPQLPTVAVNAEQARRLDFGNQIISMVRQKIPYGAGNLAVDVARTGGVSEPRTARVYEVHGVAKQQLNKQGFKPKLLAGIAAKYGAGNCDMAGSMAYTMMRAALSADFEVMLIINRGGGHTYAAFKEANAPDSTAIIVDPWPTSGMATLAQHHFQGVNINGSIIRKNGKWDEVGPVRDRVALNAHYNTLSTAIDQDILNVSNGAPLPGANYTHYSNELCSSVVGRYQDPNNRLLPLPVERPMLQPPPLPQLDSDGDVVMG